MRGWRFISFIHNRMSKKKCLCHLLFMFFQMWSFCCIHIKCFSLIFSFFTARIGVAIKSIFGKITVNLFLHWENHLTSFNKYRLGLQLSCFHPWWLKIITYYISPNVPLLFGFEMYFKRFHTINRRNSGV